MDHDYDSFQQHLNVSLQGTHAILQRIIPSMIENIFGKIIGISSTFSMGEPPERMAPYVVAKSALNSYLKCLAIDYGPFGINTNIVAPSMTESAMLAKVPERQVKVAAAKNPLRRLGKPKDIASAVSFLASSEADYMNGETLVVSGGSFIR
jgi:3-oxoacyl-[acyl-carrier protein] reductase